MTSKHASDQRVTFRDAKLHSLPLRIMNATGSIASTLARRQLPTLSADSIVEQAIKEAGSADLGSDSWQEPLNVYLSAVEKDGQLNTFGRIAVKGLLVRSLRNRIQLQDWMKNNPAAGEQRIVKPWIILGLPRTGTSLLSILLGLSPLARPLLHWETGSPIPPPNLATANDDPRIAHSQSQTEQLLTINPALKAMHPFGAMLAEECTALFMYDLRTVGLETQAFVPDYGRWLENADMHSAYAIHKQVLQALQHEQPTEQWVLKSPNHLWCIDTLMETYPDARIIWTHRNPAQVVTSLASLTNALQRPMTLRRDPVPVANDWKHKLQDGLAKGMAYDQQADAGWCYHLPFNELMNDPVAAIQGIYDHFGEPMSQLHQQRVHKWLEYRPQNAFGIHHYDEKDFGWTKDRLEEEFSDYARRYC